MKQKPIRVYGRYNLIGYVAVTSWMDSKGYACLNIETGAKGLKEIKENPLQDYLCFGVKSVDFALFDVCETLIKEYKDYIVRKEYTIPKYAIVKGRIDAKLQQEIEDNWIYANVIEVNYDLFLDD